MWRVFLVLVFFKHFSLCGSTQKEGFDIELPKGGKVAQFHVSCHLSTRPASLGRLGHHWKNIFTQKVHDMHHPLIISREGLILTLPILSWPQGKISRSAPFRKIYDERMAVLHQNSGGVGKSIPIRSRHLSRGNLLGITDGFSNTSLILVWHRYNASPKYSMSYVECPKRICTFAIQTRLNAWFELTV